MTKCPNCGDEDAHLVAHRCLKSDYDTVHCGCFYEREEHEVVEHVSRCACAPAKRDGVSKLTKAAYEALIAEDLEWLAQWPRTLERDHIEAIVRASVNFCYPSEPVGVSGTDAPAVADSDSQKKQQAER